MTTTVTRTLDDLDDQIFSREAYEQVARRKPEIDGIVATAIDVKFGGQVAVDVSDDDWGDFLAALKFGEEIRAIVVATPHAKAFTRRGGKDSHEIEVGHSITLRVTDLEFGESACAPYKTRAS